MKKKYINPTIEIIDINMDQQLLAGSTPSLGGDYSSGDILAPEFESEELTDFEL